MAKKLSLLSQLKEDVMCDQISRLRNGDYMFRRGFYYRNGNTKDTFLRSIEMQLMNFGVPYRVEDFGEKWAAFRGGASMSSQSHWWVQVRFINQGDK